MTALQMKTVGPKQIRNHFLFVFYAKFYAQIYFHKADRIVMGNSSI